MSYSSEVLADSPALYAKLDDTSGTTCVDSSATGLNGTYSGTFTLAVAALINAGTAVSFNGSSGAAAFDEGAGTQLDCTTGHLTVEAWIKTTQSGASNPMIVCADDSSNRRFMQFRLSTTGKLEFILITSGGVAHTCDGATTVNDGAAHHVVGTYDGTTMRVYVDGAQDATLTVTFTPGNASPLFNIARRRSSGSSTNFFNGTIDEVAYYNSTALSAARILAHFNAAASLTAVGASLSAPYVMRAAVPATARLPYAIIAAVAATAQLPYRILSPSAVGVSAALPYTVRAAIGASVQLDYELLVPVAGAVALPYSFTQSVAGVLHLPYALTSHVGRNLRMDWQIAEGVLAGADLRLPYQLRAAAARPVSFGYGLQVHETTVDQVVITLSGSPTGGTFTITVDGETTAPIAFDATAAAVQAALDALPGVGAGGVVVTGGPGPEDAWVATFVAAPGSVTVDASGLTGGHTPGGSAEPGGPHPDLMPEIRVRLAFGSSPLAHNPVWTNVSHDFLEYEVSRGRQLELDQEESGTMTLRLQDRAGDYDPTNESSPYFPYVVPWVRVRVEARINGGTWSPRYDGLVETWTTVRDGPRGQTVTLDCVDLTSYFNGAQVAQANLFFPEQHVDDRIRAAIADAGVSSGRTRINTGNVRVQANTYSPGTTDLTVLQDAADAELPGVGILFTDRAGMVVFLGRQARFGFTVAAIFGDDASYAAALADVAAHGGVFDVMPLKDVALSLDVEHVINSATVYPAGVDDLAVIQSQRVQNAASIAKYGRRDLDLPDLLVQQGTLTGNDALDECKAYGQFYVDNRAEGAVRASQLQLTGGMASSYPTLAMWSFLQRLELGQVAALYTQHPGGGGINGDIFFIEGYTERVASGRDLQGPVVTWTTELELSPASLWATGAVLGVA